MYANLCSTTLARSGVAQEAQATVWDLVQAGGYVNELDYLIEAHGESLPPVAQDFDAHLIETSALVQGALDVQTEGLAEGASARSTASADGSGSVVGSDSVAPCQDPIPQSDEFLEAMEGDVRAFEEFMQERAVAAATLGDAEAEYANEMSSDAQKIADTFGDKFSPMMSFKADYKPFLLNLQKLVEDRVAEVARLSGCAAEDVQRVVIRFI